jgi:putative membrane protein
MHSNLRILLFAGESTVCIVFQGFRQDKTIFRLKEVEKVLGTVVRFVVSALVLMLVSWLLPGIRVSGFTGALIAAIVIAILGYLIELALGERISPRSRGIVGFVVSVIVIYAAQYIIPNYLSVTILGALLAAFVIGLIDAFVPTELR